MEEKYLPLGTVVLLNGGEKRVMITGFVSMSPDTGERVFDYSGCLFPEGFYDYNEVLVFDHHQIAKVFHKGLVDEEELNFKKNLVESVSKLNIPQVDTQNSTPNQP